MKLFLGAAHSISSWCAIAFSCIGALEFPPSHPIHRLGFLALFECSHLRHTNGYPLQPTQRYIESDAAAQRRVVDLV